MTRVAAARPARFHMARFQMMTRSMLVQGHAPICPPERTRRFVAFSDSFRGIGLAGLRHGAGESAANAVDASQEGQGRFTP